MSLGACTKQGFLAAPEADPEVTGKVGSFSTDTHFLLEPTSEAEELLGRAVHISKDGGWTIAGERAPGCQVRVKRSTAEYEKSYRIGLGDMTAISGGYTELLQLEARYGRSVEAAMKIQNLETLTADTEGPCGEVIVNSVRIGTGERRLVRKAEAGVQGRVGKGPVVVAAGREGLTDVSDEMKWTSPQGYAFTYGELPQRKVFDFQASVPNSVVDGQEIEFEFNASEDAYLVVFFLEESGAGAVLYPNALVPVPMVKAGKSLTLPTPEELKIAAQLRDPLIPARETLVVYAFTTREEFEQFKPAAMGDGDNAVPYAANLTQALAGVPISRWARSTLTYDIQPKS
ncbi:MAG: DUF4384 domain-containing protein [Nannocystis sp.]|nr:DUF4384 domain-containing protein [Nannocystis sp.]MBA3548339.1 DUF4384 domain-containing protein [Nannocystis sp.]